MTAMRKSFVLGATALLLAACGGLREDLGLGRNPPDEFAVVERPPLSMPPDYGLHPPRPGAPRPQAVDPRDQASAALFNGSSTTHAGESASEKALLSAAGATNTDPTIRDTVDKEAAQKVIASPHLVDRLMNWGDKEKPAATVDPAAEAERIKKAQSDNQPVNSGATPVIEKQDSGWLGL